MKKTKITKLQCIVFLSALVVMFIILDIILSAAHPVGSSELFPKDNFEITVAIHETTDFEKLFYGSSPLVSAFRQYDSTSGYAELGMVYAKITYLLTMLERGFITVSDDIVLGLSTALFMDELDTDPRYIWHRRPLEPYLYFHRDRLNTFLTNAMDNILDGNFTINRHTSLVKWLYFGNLSDEELDEMLQAHSERFWDLDITSFSENFAALGKLAEFCRNNDIRLRAVWMPTNPNVTDPELYVSVYHEVNRILTANGIEINDMTNAFPPEYFYDYGHLNYELGAVEFTKEIDKWLKK